MTHDHPLSVRLAWPREAAQISQVQHACYAADLMLSKMLDQISLEQMTKSWYEAITKPPLANFRVLVALDENNTVQGFAALGPSEDDDAEPTDAVITEFDVHPDHLDQGHQDRLLHAIADTLRADGFERATWWLPTTDDQMRSWLTQTGWAADGAYEEIGDETGTIRIRQIRMHTLL